MISKLEIANTPKKDNNITFTKDQEIAVHKLIEFLAQPWDDKKFINALCGAGGTGKTFVIKYVIDNCKWSNSVIGCAAPTHKACRVLSSSIGNKEVNTIQSVFGFRLAVDIENFDPENPAFNPKGKIVKMPFAKELFHITTCYNRGNSESTILAFQEWKEYEDKVKNNLIDVNNELE